MRLLEFFCMREAGPPEMGKLLLFRRPKPKPAGKVTQVPLRSLFKEQVYTLRKQDYDKKQYSWGFHRTISVGMSYTVAIDERAWWRIRGLKPGDQHTFVDDSNSEWEIKRGAEGEDHPEFEDDRPIFRLYRGAGQEQVIAMGFWDEMVRALS
jgi:hypothetical protein